MCLRHSILLHWFFGLHHSFERAAQQIQMPDAQAAKNCGRGYAELYIKDHKLGLVSERLAAHAKKATPCGSCAAA